MPLPTFLTISAREAFEGTLMPPPRASTLVSGLRHRLGGAGGGQDGGAPGGPTAGAVDLIGIHTI